ncbi:MAG TPA: AAA family ATPase [Clostridia bacterium]|nr:AAA family ATPase [Clostridia bacterium]
MNTVIAICNQKGGVAKTATAHQLAAGLSRLGKKVLAIDLDPQSNFTICAGLNIRQLEAKGCTIYDVLSGKRTIEEVVCEVKDKEQFSFMMLGGTMQLARADAEFTGVSAPFLLREALEEYKTYYDYDFIIIDTPPTLGTLPINALTAADFVLVPYKAEALTVVGMYQLSTLLTEVKKRTNKSLRILGILLTMYDTRTKNASKAALSDAEQVAEILKTKVFETKIRATSAMKVLPASCTDIFNAAPTSSAAMDYEAFVNELLEEVAK